MIFSYHCISIEIACITYSISINIKRISDVRERLFIVGKYRNELNQLTGRDLPCSQIMQSSGIAVHVQKHHPNEIDNIALIPQIIANPDYVGRNP